MKNEYFLTMYLLIFLLSPVWTSFFLGLFSFSLPPSSLLHKPHLHQCDNFLNFPGVALPAPTLCPRLAQSGQMIAKWKDNPPLLFGHKSLNCQTFKSEKQKKVINQLRDAPLDFKGVRREFWRKKKFTHWYEQQQKTWLTWWVKKKNLTHPNLYTDIQGICKKKNLAAEGGRKKKLDA